MILSPVWRLAQAACLVCLVIGCDSSSSGAGGSAGAGGGGGTGGGVPVIATGLWEGVSEGIRLCFFVSDDGLRLTPSTECDLTGLEEAGAQSFSAKVDLIGRDENGQPCSFDLAYDGNAAIDPVTRAFGVSGIEAEPGGARLSFTGQVETLRASGVAQSESGGSACQVGWEATPASRCDDAAIQSCLDLQDCCQAILVNPVFFQSCNSVVLQCDQEQCLRVLAGYPSCTDL